MKTLAALKAAAAALGELPSPPGGAETQDPAYIALRLVEDAIADPAFEQTELIVAENTRLRKALEVVDEWHEAGEDSFELIKVICIVEWALLGGSQDSDQLPPTMVRGRSEQSTSDGEA